ncbi:MAG: 3-dehydroquinate synthase [Candidatus Gastranaerophilales bacterium]|nr:3-dehydroquinate synthase [Candidatus Gastranaerophilales bacterium]
MKKLTVNLTEGRSYPIIIKEGALNEAKALLEEHLGKEGGGHRYFVITNKTIAKIYSGFLKGFENIIRIDDGEKFKNFKTFEYITGELLKAKIERKDCIIAFGGGVVGDMAGFAAASVLRGVDYVQIPTTLLSQVDSSVGGKTGFNHVCGKNLIGAFKQPKLVIIDPKTLDTLDIRQIKTGLGEVLKYAFIEKSTGCEEFNFFNRLKSLLNEVNGVNGRAKGNLYESLKKHWEEIIYTSVSMKASVVSKDECEKGLRAILNFGHTFGHAVEKITNYKKYTHGEAVAAGMVMAFQTALKRNLINEDYFHDAVQLISNYGLISESMKNFNKEKMFDAMKSDKKVSHSKIKLVLPVKPLEVQLFDDTEAPLIKDSLL